MRRSPAASNDPELFFAERPEDVERAKALCTGCPVRPACMAGALERREPWGVWGGELFVQGVVVARKRPRGRPAQGRGGRLMSAATSARPCDHCFDTDQGVSR